MAKALDVGVADFIRSRNDNLAFVHGEFRKSSRLSKSQQEYVREAVEEYFGRFFDAVDYLGGEPLPSPPDIHCLKSSGDFEKDAVQLRNQLSIPQKGPIEDVIAILENQGILVIMLDFDNRHFSGMNGTVNGYPYIVVNKNMTAERIRSTISHELTHMMFELDDDINEEQFATEVSGAFLITKEDILREMGVRRSAITKDFTLICKEYGISMYLLVVRASQAKVISSSVAQGFYIKAGKAGWRTNEPSRIKGEKPLLFEQLVFRAINEEDISIQKGVELLQIPYAEVEEGCGLVEV
jgi:Zn-dependent peptidase ImmA (M78 family)